MGSLFGGGAAKAAKKAERKAAEEAKVERRRIEEEQARVRADEAARQERIGQGTAAVNTAFAGFDDPYYAGLAEKYAASQKGDLESQFKKAQEQLIYSLAGRGLINSSVASEKAAELTNQQARGAADIADAASAYSSRARENVEGQRRNLIAQAYATADPATVATQAVQTAKSAAPETISPLAAAFDTGMGELAKADPYGTGLVNWDSLDPAARKKKPAQQIIGADDPALIA